MGTVVESRWMLLLGSLACLGAAHCSSAETTGSARICLTAINSASAEVPLTEAVSPHPGERLLVHLDASIECAALLLPLARGGSRLANGWRPQIVELPAWTEMVSPMPPVKWEWQKNSDPFELWVLFFKNDTPEFGELEKLVRAMQPSSGSEQLLTQQTRKLCDMLTARMTGKAKISQGPKADSTLIGGTVRQADFPWRDYATKVALNGALEGELVLRHGR